MATWRSTTTVVLTGMLIGTLACDGDPSGPRLGPDAATSSDAAMPDASGSPDSGPGGPDAGPGGPDGGAGGPDAPPSGERAWVGATLIEDRDEMQFHAARLGLDATGRVLLVWAQAGIIWERRFDPSTGWGATAALTGVGAADPDVAVDARGDAVLVWRQASAEIWTRAYRAGTGWGAPTLLAAPANGLGHFARVALADDGTAIAVWTQRDDQHAQDLIARRFVPGEGWGAPVPLEGLAPSVAAPDLAIHASGAAMVAWAQVGPTPDIWATRFTPGTGWEPATLLFDGGWAARPQVKMDAAGNALVLWYDEGPDEADGTVGARRHLAGTGWGPAVELDRDAFVHDPTLAVDPRGRAIAAWYASGGEGDPATVRTRRFTPEGGWEPIVPAETTDRPSSAPRVAMSPDGAATLAWVQPVGDGAQIWARRFTPEQGWAPHAAIGPSTDARGLLRPELAAGPSGEVAAAWMLTPDVDARAPLELWANVYR